MGQKCSCFDILKPKKKLQAAPNVEVPLQSMVYVKNNNPISNVRLRNDDGNLMGDREYVYMKSELLTPKKKPDDKELSFEVKDRMLILGPSKDGISIATKDWPFVVPDSTGFVDSKTLSEGFENTSYCHDLPYVSSQPKLAFLDNDARYNESGSPISYSPRSSEISPKPSEMNKTVSPIPLSINQGRSEVLPKPFEMNDSVPPTPLPKGSEVFPRASEMDENFPAIPPRINQGNCEVFSKPFKIDETVPASLPDINPRSNDFSLDPFKMDDLPRLD